MQYTVKRGLSFIAVNDPGVRGGHKSCSLLPNLYYLAFLKEILGQMIYKEVEGGSLGKANT